MDTIEIPNKSSFKFNEVCSLANVKPHVLRFWESEFDKITPLTSSSGQKLYEHKDIEMILEIKKLLFEDKLSIPKVKMMLDHEEDDSIESIDMFTPQIPLDSSKKRRGPVARRSLTDSDVQKLVLAKAKLSSMISTINSIKSDNRWS